MLRRLRSLLAVLLLTPATQAEAQVGPAPAAGPWPQWIQLGARATFYNASATVPGSLQTLEPDENGNWVNKKTGQRFSAQDRPGGAAAGLEQITVYGVSPQRIVFKHTKLLFDPAGAPGVTTMTSAAEVATLQQGIDLWRPPALLAQLPEVLTGPNRISRLNYTLNGQQFNALRMSDTEANTRSWRTYDLDTGLLLQLSISSRMSPRMRPDGDGAGFNEGDVMLVHMHLMSVRQTNIPGPGSVVPPPHNQLGTLRFAMQQQFRMPPAPPNPPIQNQGEMALTFDGEVMQVRSPQYSNVGPTAEAYIAPAMLQQLQPSQVLDQDPISGVSTIVVAPGNGLIGISEQNPREQSTHLYDPQSGFCVMIHRLQASGGSATSETMMQLSYLP